MRICISYYESIGNPWRLGGASVSSWEIGRELADRGHQVLFVTGNFPEAGRLVDNKVGWRRLGSSHSYGLSVCTYYLAYPFGLKGLQRHFDVLLEGWTSPFPFTPLWLKKPVVALVHILLGSSAFKERGLLGLPSFLSESVFWRFYRNYILFSPDYVRLEGDRNVLICPPGVDRTLLELESCEENYILFVGRLTSGGLYQKGLDILLTCFSRARHAFPNVRLVVVGNGDTNAHENAQKLARGITGVEFTGRVSEAAKSELLRKCLFVCMPSRFESAGIVALEAQACGKATVGFDIPGLNSIVRNGETGILVTPFNLAQLTDAMQLMLADPGKRRELGKNARQWASNFTWEKATDKIERFLGSVV